MLAILKNRTYAQLFSAQVIALLGTGLLTVALGLLAFDLAGPAAGAVLGTAYTIKMIAYVGLSPITAAITARLPRKAVLIVMDVLRAAVALCLPFVTEIWQIYVLIFLLQSASATFTPAFQATIPDILPDEAEYTRALSLSRLAYDIENLISPTLAGLLLLVMDFHWLFAGTFAGFVLSALLVQRTTFPKTEPAVQRPFRERVTRGSWIYLSTPRLRGLLAFNFTATTAGAFVIVNTVVMVRSTYGFDETALAQALAAFGAGSMLAALTIPRLLDSIDDRKLMSTAALALGFFTLGHASLFATFGAPPWGVFLLAWALTGILYSAILTPSGRLLRRSAHPEDRTAIFTAQFALSHACWLITYPTAGWVATLVSLPAAMAILGALGLVSATLGLRLWTGHEGTLSHDHPDLPDDHPHLMEHGNAGQHVHPIIIDDNHRRWPQHR